VERGGGFLQDLARLKLASQGKPIETLPFHPGTSPYPQVAIQEPQAEYNSF
jgi:hypothetical protein